MIESLTIGLMAIAWKLTGAVGMNVLDAETVKMVGYGGVIVAMTLAFIWCVFALLALIWYCVCVVDAAAPRERETNE